MDERNILIVAPYFAPFSGVGANRMISLATFLRDSGFTVTVLRNINVSLQAMYTAEEPAGISYVDIKLDRELPFEELSDIYLRETESLVKANNFACIIITLGPYYTLKSVERIKSISKVPVILDFRDLFAYEVMRHESLKGDIGHIFFSNRRKRIERPAVALSDAIVTVTPDDANRMQKYYHEQKHRIFTIGNGYDESRLNSLDKNQKKNSYERGNNTVEIGFFGKMFSYSESYALKLLKAIKKVQDRGYSVRLIHMGPKEELAEKMARSIGLQEDTYCYLGSKKYSEGMEILGKVDFLGLVYCSPTGYGTKIFDYIYLNKPVLMMGRRKMELAKFVNSFTNGFSCTTVKQYEAALISMIDNKACVLDPQCNPSLYERRTQNEKYLMLISELIK